MKRDISKIIEALEEFKSPKWNDETDKDLMALIGHQRGWKDPSQSYYDFKKKNPLMVAVMRCGLKRLNG